MFRRLNEARITEFGVMKLGDELLLFRLVSGAKTDTSSAFYPTSNGPSATISARTERTDVTASCTLELRAINEWVKTFSTFKRICHLKFLKHANLACFIRLDAAFPNASCGGHTT